MENTHIAYCCIFVWESHIPQQHAEQRKPAAGKQKRGCLFINDMHDTKTKEANRNKRKRKDNWTVKEWQLGLRQERGIQNPYSPRWKAPRTCPQSYVHDKLMLHMQTDTLTCHSFPQNLENKVQLKNRKRQEKGHEVEAVTHLTSWAPFRFRRN